MTHVLAFSKTPSTLLVFAWAQSMLARTYSLDSCQKLSLKVQPCSTSTVTRRILETNAWIMPPHLVRLAWCRTITFPHVGRVTHLISFHALTFATTLVTSWKFHVILEQRACLPPSARRGDTVLFYAVFRCGLHCVHHRPLGRSTVIRSA